MKFVTTREIASIVGCSHVTVSRALNNKRRVNKELKAKILAVAKELGYRPNPMVSSLMAVRGKKGQPSQEGCTIGWLNSHPNPYEWGKHSYKSIYLDGARERCEEIGYNLDMVWGVEPGMTGTRLLQILNSRGIHGLIIPSALWGVSRMNVRWDDLAVACIGARQPDQFAWHRATLAVRDSLAVCIRQLLQLGFSRIGLALQSANVEDSTPAGESIFRYFAYSNPSRFIEEILRYERRNENWNILIKEWITRNNPQVIICADIAMLSVCGEMGLRVPEDVSLFHIHLADDVKGWAGLNPFEKRQAAAAVDLVASQLQHNERGLPPYAKIVQIYGEWQDGWTLRYHKK